MQYIYFDNNSTTPLHAKALEAMMPYFTEKYGNAASATHRFGWQAAAAVDIAQSQVAESLGVEPAEITFTSGATESINMALRGLFESYKRKGNHIIVCKTEHKAVLDTCAFLQTCGASISYIDVHRDGIIDLAQLESELSDHTIMVVVMLANNETGVIQPIEKIAELAHSKGAIMVCDTTQAIGKMRCSIPDLNVDVAFISAHKFYGPKGTGAIYLRRKNPRVTIPPLLYGGGDEKHLRPGTINVPAIVGFGKACTLAIDNLWEYGSHTSRLRTLFEQIFTEDDVAFINGSTRERLPNTTNLCFQNVTAQQIIKHIDNVAVSTGSACTSALAQPSHVLLAMGLSQAQAQNSIRFSFGIQNTLEEMKETGLKILELLKSKK